MEGNSQNTRQLTAELSNAHGQIADLQETVRQCQEVIVKQHDALSKMMGEPLCHGTVIELHDHPNPSCYERDDEVLVVDEASPHFNKGGVVFEHPMVGDTEVAVKLLDMSSTVTNFRFAQVRLTMKDDGTYAIVLVDGKHWEVKGGSGMGLSKGDTVKVRADNKKIVGKGYELAAGPICHIAAVREDGVEVEEKGEKRFIANPRAIDIAMDDRVMVDTSFSILVKKLPKESRDRYRISETSVSWDDIGGLEDAKRQIRMAIEIPFQKPDIFAHYNMKRARGLLLYGPPGNGKTLLMKAAANAVAVIHGRQAVHSGYRYIKSPEMLDKWIGNTERAIRGNFDEGRQHFWEHGYPAIHVYDEADAIMPQRGMRRSSDIADTMVPMFLAEMDGADDRETDANPIICLLSNRADTLDPAITRPGRISHHVKIDRPDLENGLKILGIHARDMPIAREGQREAALAITVNDIFSRGRLLYRVNNEFDFTLSDATSGAMLAGIVESAKEVALNRDLASGKLTGVTVEDLRSAVNRVFHQQRGVNHSYDLADFAEKHGLQPNQITVDRCYGAT